MYKYTCLYYLPLLLTFQIHHTDYYFASRNIKLCLAKNNNQRKCTSVLCQCYNQTLILKGKYGNSLTNLSMYEIPEAPHGGINILWINDILLIPEIHSLSMGGPPRLVTRIICDTYKEQKMFIGIR